MTSNLNYLNKELFLWINSFNQTNIILDKIGIFLAEYSPYIFILFSLYIWFIKKEKCKEIVLNAGYSAILGIVINFIISIFYFHARPFMDKIGNTLVTHKAENSFPSDHTTFMLSIAFILLYFKETRFAGIILSILGLVGGFSRVFVGVHYPFDIFGSIIVAIISAYIIFSLESKGKLKFINNFIINLYYKIIKK